jgi:hypothetical protein
MGVPGQRCFVNYICIILVFLATTKKVERVIIFDVSPMGFFIGWFRITGCEHTHRDGVRSVYCFDPDDNRLQMMCQPPMIGT